MPGLHHASLKDTISAALPPTFTCKLRHVYTAPRRCDALFSPPPGSEPEKTQLSSHFLTISARPHTNDTREDVFVVAIEALVYHTKALTTIFVSKADTTGYLPQQRFSPTRQIATAFLRFLSAKERHKHPKRELVVSLFARSQSQYLFPGSADNGQKHILDDRKLIKWWARVLDPLFPTQADGLEYHGYVTVPGFDGPEVRPFFPQSAQAGERWHSGTPLESLAQVRGLSRGAPPRCMLPRFLDDPKARFMIDLDDESGFSEDTLVSPSKRKSGKWKSIWNLDRFWEAMEFRQECSSGRMVGFIWLIISDPQAKQDRELPESGERPEEASQDTANGASTTVDGKVYLQDGINAVADPQKRRRKPLTGPIVPRQPRLKGGSSSLTASSGLENMLETGTADGLLLSKDGYDQAMQTLLQLDFADVGTAAQSTKKWDALVTDISGCRIEWSIEVTGTSASMAAPSVADGANHVNDLGGMVRKKKRKADDVAIVEGHAPSLPSIEGVNKEQPAVTMLGSGTIRKKPKPVT